VTPTPLNPTPAALTVDVHGTGATSNLNGVFESGETVVVEPAWENPNSGPLTFTGAATAFTGPSGPTYGIVDGTADYATVAGGATADCYTATPSQDCYAMSLSGTRPVVHWDGTFLETLSLPVPKTWTLHVGRSFADVPTSQMFYAFIENIFHNGITAGCGGSDYCPTSPITRAQMAVFILKGKYGASYVPPPCTQVFDDVPCSNPYGAWIGELYDEGITGGCGGNNYCPNAAVTRAQMAVFLLKAKHGSSYDPPVCSPPGVFTDVACPSLFADWIEELYAEAITGGCGTNIYCPSSPNNRGQMAVFIVKTFGLLLYGP
jgi:hypothetical protein